jgi:magnesium transporter
MTGDLISARVDTDQEEVARQVAAYNLLAIPVVDEENKLVGIITVDDVIDVIKEEATEDILRLAGVATDDRASSPTGETFRKRLPWLAINLGTAFIAVAVIASFEGTLKQYTALAFFLPIVAGMGGNAGTQTLTVIVRGLALGELAWSNARKALVKEILVGLGNGVILGTVAALIVWGLRQDPMLGAVLGMAMVVNLFVAATAGTLIPLGLRAANVDPALASSIFITTMTDVFGFFAYLGLATLFAQYLTTG